MAQWIRRLPTEQEIPGSSPGRDFFCIFYLKVFVAQREVKEKKKKKKVEEQGIDPCASCMLSTRSTI